MFTINRNRIVLSALLFLVAGSGLLFAQTVEVLSARGKVEYRQGSAAWQTVTVGMNLPVGATISTGFGASAELLAGDAEISVAALTRLTIEELIIEQGSQDTDMFLQVGRVRASVRTGEDVQHNFQVRSTVSTAAVRGTEFEYDGYTVTGFEGAVSFSSNSTGLSQIVGAGDQSNVGPGAAPPEPPRQERRRESETRTKPETPRDRGQQNQGPPQRQPDRPGEGGIDDVVESDATLVIEFQWPQ